MKKLRKQAEESATFRGHSLVWGEPWNVDIRCMQNATCKHCFAEVQINTHPLPNEIAVGGTAVALNCPYVERV